MVRCWGQSGKVLVALAVCFMLRMSVGKLIHPRSTDRLTLTVGRNQNNPSDIQKKPSNGFPIQHSQSEALSSDDSQSVNRMSKIPENTNLHPEKPQLLNARNIKEYPKTRIKRTSSAITLAAARRRLLGQRQKSKNVWVERKPNQPVRQARRVGTAVRLAAARRRVRVGGRRRVTNTQQRENTQNKEKTGREKSDVLGNLDANRQQGNEDEESRRQTENNTREAEERRRQIEESKRQAEERRRQIEDSKRQAEESRRQSEESRRQAEDDRRREEESRRQSEESIREEERRRQIEESRRQLEERRRQEGNEGYQPGRDEYGNNAGVDHSRHAEDERRRKLEEEARRRGQGHDGQGQTTSAPVVSRDRQDIRNRCTDCRVGDQTFRGHSRFEYVEDCIKHHCICRCDGTKECPDTHTQNVCGGRGSEPERPTERPTARPAERPTDRPVDTRIPSSRSCRTCDAKGQIIEGGKFFDLQEDCTLFRNCKCFCNGTWSCSAETAETICVRTDQGTTIQNGNRIVDTTACRQCTMVGRQYQGNSTFQLLNVCMATTCFCFCDGSVECDPSSSVNVCIPEVTTGGNLEIVISRNMKKIDEHNCQKCFIQGNPVDGNSKFQLKWPCFLDACYCDCQGRYSCVRQLGENLCNLTTVLRKESAVDRQCRGCLVDGKSYRGNSGFRYTQGCTQRDCRCTCDGTMECDERTAVNVCVTSPNFVDPESEVVDPGDVHTPNQGPCVQCNVNGSAIHGDSYFERRQGCYIEQCHCQCDGRLNCRRIPGQEHTLCNETTERTGSKDDQRICRRCLFQGKDYPGNTMFVYTNGCAATNCICTCDGGVDCDYTSTVNICEVDATSPSPVESNTTTVKPTESDQCKVCPVDGKEFAGGADFELKRGCKVYPCQCRCDGNWGCDVNAAKDVCGREDDESQETTTQVSNHCRTCLYHGNEYGGDTRFQFTNSCVTINCKCDCHGNVECDYTSTVNSCVTRAPAEPARPATQETTTIQERSDGCQSCTVDGKDFGGGSDFELKRGCFVYPCQCNCEGRWGCITDKVKDVCKEDTDDDTQEEECQTCAVEGREYEGNSTFYHKHECTQRTCLCTCSGAVQCDDRTAVNICEPQTTTTSSPAGGLAVQITCRKCNLGGEEYEGNSTFVYTDSCTAKYCTCTCTGAVECDDRNAINICTTTTTTATITTPQTVTRSLKRNKKKEGCQGCSVEGQGYAGGSKFKLKRGCLAYPCHCDCSGRWWCDRENAKNICSDDTDESEGKKTCYRCDVEGRRFAGDSEFRLRKGCISYKCKCLCDGTWNCPPDEASNYCPGSTEATEATSPATEALPFREVY